MDRNFDELAERFERRVYGGLKGDVRLSVLWRDLLPIVQRLEQQGQPLKILDIGGGTTEVAIISISGVSFQRSIRVGGDELDEAIVAYMKKAYGL